MAAGAVSQARNECGEGADGGDDGVRVRGGAHLYRGKFAFGVDRGGATEIGDGGAPGMVGEFVHHGIGYVSEEHGGRGGRDWDERGFAGRHAAGVESGLDSAGHAQLREPVHFGVDDVFAGAGDHSAAGSGAEKSGVRGMSLYAAHGDVQMEIAPTELRSLLFAALDKLGPRRRVLVVPPDITRLHSRAGELARWAWEYYGEALRAVLPALGTHAPMSAEQLTRMFGDLPQSLIQIHNWRTDVETLG